MRTKKILALALAFVTVLSAASLTACNKNKGPVMSKRTNVYGITELALPDGVQWISQMTASGDNIYLVYDKSVEVIVYPDGAREENSAGLEPEIAVYTPAGVEVAETKIAVEEEGVTEELPDGAYISYENQTWVYSTNLDGSVTGEYQIELGTDGNGYMNRIIPGSDGNLYILYENWSSGESQFVLYTVNPQNGEVTGSADLAGIREAAELEEGAYFYINNMAVDGNTAYFCLETGLIPYDLSTGSTGKKIDYSDAVSWANNLFVEDGQLYIIGYVENEGPRMFAMDPASGEFVKQEIEGLSDSAYYSVIGSMDGKICFSDTNGITAWDPASGTVTEILNYINCDVNSSEVNTIAMMPDGRFCYSGSTYDDEGSHAHLCVLTRIPDEQMQEEVLLTVGAVYNDYNLRSVVIDFNRQNTGVRLNIKSYENYNNEENEYTGAVTQLNADITMGNVPDILMVNSELPVESYYSKGVFADLYPYMDDPEVGINRADFLENVFKACEQDGRLYSLIATFSLQTLAAKPEYVGTESGWTLAEMLDTIDNAPEDMIVFYDFGREYLKDTLLQNCGDLFVDWENGTANFESEEFIRLIEFLKSVPEKSVQEQYYDSIDYDNYDYEAEMEFYNNYQMRYFKNLAMINQTYISGFNAYNSIHRTFAGEATLIGFPTNSENSSGAVISPNMELAICAASQNKDSAWTFLKYLMTSEEFFEDTYGFTISRTWMDKQLAESEETYADWYYEYTDEDWAYYEENYSAEYVEYMKQSQTKYTMEQGQKVYNVVLSADKVIRNDSSLMDIIDEELSTFFGGARTAAATAEIINSRARIYISENS